jgi:hypothetical protein
VSPGVKFETGADRRATIVVVGKRLVDGFIELKDRRSGERTTSPSTGGGEIAALVRDGS